MTQPTSFLKSLLFGHIPEEMIFPYPRARDDESRESLELIVESVRRFAAEKIDSHRIDTEERLTADVLEGLKELGLLGLSIPEVHGGVGLSTTGYARVMQELAGIDGSVAVTVGAHQSIGCKAITLFGTEAQKKQYLPDLATGKRVAAFALTEPGSGSDAASIKTRAVKSADGSHWVLNGQKIWITNGGFADVFTVFAQTTVEVETKSGREIKDRITAFIVERAHGVRSGKEEKKLGIKGSSTVALFFEDCKVPAENVIGEVGGGFKVAMEVLNNGRLGLAAGCIGASKSVFRHAVEHATTRKQFGKPIAEFGLIKDKLGRVAAELFAAESMVYLTCGLIDAGVHDYSLESASCKVFCSEMLWRCVNEALQISAGVGYMKEYPYERALRDARINLIFEGTNEILRLFIALSGMQGPGDRLAKLAEVIREPVKSYGVLADFVVQKIKTSVYGSAELTRAHSALKREAVLIEEATDELTQSVEKVLRKHGKRIVEMQFAQRRVADIIIDLFAMLACVARATDALERFGLEHERAVREAALGRTFCGQAARRIRYNLRRFDDNDDERLKELAQGVVDHGGYDLDAVMDR
jgi:acyl-CoA dehydrogenase family protein 9